MPHACWVCLAGALHGMLAGSFAYPCTCLSVSVGSQDGVNLLEGFSQGSGPTPAPEEAFLAGILHHMPALQTFTTPSPLSYERLKPGCWSGAYQ